MIKSKKFLLVLVFCFLPLTSVEARDPMHTFTEFGYTFSNGNKLFVVPGKGVMFRPRQQGAAKIITNYPRIEQFFETDALDKAQWVGGLTENHESMYGAWVRHVNRGSTFQVFEAGPQIFFVNQDGKSFALPLPDQAYEHARANIDGTSGSTWNWSFIYFNFRGQTHGVFSLKKEGDTDAGISFVLREDGRILTLGEQFFGDVGVKVTGTDLEINGFPQKYDLMLLDTAPFPPRLPRRQNQDEKVPDEYGRDKKAVSEIVHENFKDYGKDVLDSQTVFDVTDPEELKDIRRSLIKKQTGSVFITGDSGSGKTELVRAFVKNVKLGRYLDIPSWTEFIQIDAASMTGGTKYTGMFEARINALIQYARGNDVILVIDEAHTLRGSGAHSQNPNDFYQMVKPYLSDGSIRLLGTTTEEEFDAAFAGDLALARRVSRIHKKPISEEKIDEAMIQWSEKMQYPRLPAEIRRRVRILSKDYDAVGLDIVKAMKLQDELYAELLINNKSPESASIEDLENVASRSYSMDKAHFDPKKREQLIKKVSAGLNEDVVGHLPIKDALLSDTLLSLTGTTDPTKPKIRRVFAGPKGLGKTYVAKAYANRLGVPFVRIIVGDYAGKAPEALLREIASAVRKNAFTVILFDEVEKAPKYIQETLLSVLDSDTLTIAESLNGTNSDSGPKTYTKVKIANSSMFFATNAGQGWILNHSNINPEELRNAMVIDGFSEFLLDRCRDVHVFYPPKTKEEFLAVVKSQMDAKIKNLENQKNMKISIKNEESFLSTLADKFFTPQAGFRAVLSEVENAVSTALAQKLVSGKSTSRCSLVLESLVPKFSSTSQGRMGF